MAPEAPNRIVIVCAGCACPLSTELIELTDDSLLSFADGTQLVPSGHLWIPSPDRAADYSQAAAGHLLVTKADTKHLVLHNQPGLLNGCCGLDGCDGPNTLCGHCGSEVATERSDCWMAHSVAFASSAVRQRFLLERTSSDA